MQSTNLESHPTAGAIKLLTNALCGLAAVLFLTFFPASDANCDDGITINDFSWPVVTEQDWSTDGSWTQETLDAVVIREKVVDDESLLYHGRIAERIYTRTRILTAVGQLGSDIEYPLAQGTDGIIDLRARTILRDGRILELTRSDILGKASNLGEKNGWQMLYFEFPGVDSNCIVEWTIAVVYDLRNTIPTYRHRTVQKDIPIERGEYVWVHADPRGPDDSYAKLGVPRYALADASTVVKDAAKFKEGTDKIALLLEKVPAWCAEPMSRQPDSATYAKMWCYYSRWPPIDDWERIAENFRESKRFKLSGGDRKKIHKAAERFRGLTDQGEILQAVYEWLQDSIVNMSYFSSPPSNAFDSKGKRITKFKENKKAIDALKRRYGTWDNIDVLYYHLLTDLGIETWPMLVVNRSEKELVAEAAFWQFDRFVVAVKDDDGAYSFHTPGDYGLPYGKLQWGWEATDGLVCSRPHSIMRTPASSPAHNEVLRVFTLELDEKGHVFGSLYEKHNGHKARLGQVRLLKGQPEEFERSLSDSLDLLLPGVEHTAIESVIDSTSPPLLMSRQALRYSTGPMTEDDHILVRPFRYTPNTKNVFTSSRRFNDIVFQYASRAVDTVHMLLDGMYRLDSAQVDSVYVSSAGSCSISFSIEEDRLTAVREFVLKKPSFAPEEYLEVKELFAAREGMSDVELCLHELQ